MVDDDGRAWLERPAGSVAITRPQISCPGTWGSDRPSLNGILPREVFTSLRHTPQVSTSRSACPERIAGSGSSIGSSALPYALTAIARIPSLPRHYRQ